MAEKVSVTRAEVEHVAALASLALTPEELDRLGGDLNSILGYVAELEQLDTAGVPPLTHVSELIPAPAPAQAVAALREDEPRPALPRELILKQAPATDGIFFKVPKVIER